MITSRYDGIVFGGGNLDGFIIYANPSDQWQFWTGDGESAADIWDVLAGPQVLFDEWQHLAITFDSDTSTKNFYVDGVLEATTTDQNYQAVTTEERSLHIGGGGDLGDQFRWVGDIDDLGLWDEVLSEDDIIDIMESGIGSEDLLLFRRGDADGDGKVNITDAVFSLAFQFSGGPAPGCMKAADVDADGILNITDAVFELQFLFSGGDEPPPPFPDCGPEPMMSETTCESSPCQG